MKIERATSKVQYFLYFGELENGSDEQKEIMEALSDLRKLIAQFNGTFDMSSHECGDKIIEKVEIAFAKFDNFELFIQYIPDTKCWKYIAQYAIDDKQAMRWSHGR